MDIADLLKLDEFIVLACTERDSGDKKQVRRFDRDQLEEYLAAYPDLTETVIMVKPVPPDEAVVKSTNGNGGDSR